jgi:hypothetical protein
MRRLLLILLAGAAPTVSPAQNSIDPADLSPAVATTPAATTPATARSATRADIPAAGEVPTATANTARAPAAAARTGGEVRPVVIDRLDLGTTSITGNQELPKVLYIVPWKRSDLGDLIGRPVNSLLDEVLAPVDPEVFERHLSYYETLHGRSQEE